MTEVSATGEESNSSMLDLTTANRSVMIVESVETKEVISITSGGETHFNLTSKSSHQTSVMDADGKFLFEDAISVDEKKKKKLKADWYFAAIYCAAWYLLFYVAVVPSFYAYPKTLSIYDEHKHPDEFIGERAQHQLLELSSIGVKLTGTYENEVLAVNFLLREINKIKATARTDLYDIDVEVQYSSGQFQLWGMAASYHNVSNVIVRLSPKEKESMTYLLVNSHFDSEVHSPAAADAGVMIVIMLETLRVISHSERELRNPIVFLFNGAEEANLLASHGFITQHRWAERCKALINLDSAGSGGREVLFQTGPDHPWLMKYYKESVPHPYASTLAEELFENDFIPSDTDFRIFKNYRGVPGLDMAHTLNGYIYHTPYDTFGNLERGTYQSTGENVLALTWALANAPELENTDAYKEGHTVYFDYLGWFMIYYTTSTGIALNVTISICAFILIGGSVFMMVKKDPNITHKGMAVRFVLIFLAQVVNIAAMVGVPMLIGLAVAGLKAELFWYSKEWMIFGMYFCPCFSACCDVPQIFYALIRDKLGMSLKNSIICFMHAHCIILAIVCLTMTGMSIRSAFFPMIAVFFYAISVALNLINGQWGKKFLFWPIHLICQVLPFWFYTYLTFAFYKTFIPMQGRDGPTSRPELLVAGFAGIMSVHFAGFIIPALHAFRKAKTFQVIFTVLALVFTVISETPLCFPFKEQVAPQRFYALHTTRTFYDASGQIYRDISGYYVQPVDPRYKSLRKTVFSNVSGVLEDCETEVYCGLPLYNSRWNEWKDSARWIEAPRPHLPIPTEIKLLKKEQISANKIRYQFWLRSADRVVIYVDPQKETKVTDWSFDLTPLKDNYPTPYFVYHTYSMDDTPLEFWIDTENTAEAPSLRLGIGAHFLYHENAYKDEFKEFLKTFPKWTVPLHWVASFESHIYE